MNRRARSSRPTTRGALLPTSLLLTLFLTGEGGAAGPGAWTPKVDWSDSLRGEIAIHMMLLRGDDSPFHSRVMWFGSEHHDEFKGGLWGWTPDEGNCSAFPSANFDSLVTPLAGYNIFCAGHSGLADGRMLVAGGNDDDIQAYGDDQAAIHTPGSTEAPGSWASVDAMHSRRWYPTNTTLRDGRVLVTAGFQHRQHRMFGGRLGGSAPTSPAGDTVRRWAPVPGGAWDPPVRPEPDASVSPPQPPVREGHTGVDLTGFPGSDNQTLFFGGIDAGGGALNDLWALKREDNVLAADYLYRWEHKSPGGSAPSARSEHSMVVGNGGVVVFGGRAGPTTAFNDMYRYAPGPEGTWAEVLVDSGVPPSPRMGHIAIYNEMAVREHHVDKFVKRMIVYGGVAAEGDAATDTAVYEFRFSPSNPARGYWRAMSESTFFYLSRHPGGPALYKPPGPRYWHRAVAGKKNVTLAGGAPSADLAYVFGGRLRDGVYSDSLWMLCLFASGTYGWVYRDVHGAGEVASEKPSPRARFSMSFDATQGESNGPRLYVHGGERLGGLTGPEVHVIDPFVFGGDWRRWGEAGYSASGHVAVRENRETHARVGEIFDPASGNWIALASAPLLELSYPVTFSVSGGSSDGGRAITASSWDGVTRYADLPGPGFSTTTWQTFPGAVHGIDAPQTGVLYRPNRLMLAGGIDQGVVTGLTRKLDALASAGWQASGSMLPRSNHNLVVLPDGTVLATGGVSNSGESTQSPVLQPQIWDADGNGGTGTWSAPGALASSTAARGYHSTAILLPDGRVLCAGGNATPPNPPFHHDEFRADIYCPPYLFNADGSLANRPVLSSAPSALRYGEHFMLCVATDTATVSKVALVRPGMTTHTFDQNQRYVPLTFSLAQTVAGTERRFLAHVPPDSSIVPPGDYLLFVVNGVGTPGIARWVRVGRATPDTDRPTSVQNLAVVQDSYRSADQGVTVEWTPPHGDSVGTCRGPAERYEIRSRLASMATWALFQQGTLVPAPPVPGLATGPKDTLRLTGLGDGLEVHVRLVSKDFAHDGGNWSAMSNELTFWVNPGGGEGGGGEGEIIPPLRSGEVAAVATTEGAAAASGFLENTLFPTGLTSEPRTDRLLLHNGPRMSGGRAQVKVSQPGATPLVLHDVRLVAVDHAAEVATDAGGVRSVGSFEPAGSVRTANGELAASLALGAPIDLAAGATMSVKFSEAKAAALVLLAVRATDADTEPIRAGLRIEARHAEGWRAVGTLLPRRLATNLAISDPGATEYRVHAGEATVLHAVGRVVPEPGETAETVLQPVTLAHSAEGDVTTSLASGVRLESGESVIVDFVAPSLESGLQRTWFMEVTAASGATSAAVVSDLASDAATARAPERLLLRAPVPNPSHGWTNITFDLPHAGAVSVEVFDLLGRRLALLADRTFPAGTHVVPWDGRTSAGAAAPPGIYSLRLRAGEHVRRVRLVRMP